MLPAFADHAAHLAALRAAALAAVEPGAAVRRALSPADLSGAPRLWLAGAGKAGAAMAAAAVEVARSAGLAFAGGVVAVPASAARLIPGAEAVSLMPAGHPEPDAGSLAAGEAMLRLFAGLGRGDLVVAVISGGGSALLELPRPGLTLADLQQTNAALLRSGATIHELNAVRRQLSQIKGGGLAQAVLDRGARLLGLILSDVVGNDLSVVASGPTVLPETIESGAPAPAELALGIVERHGLAAAFPPAVLAMLEQRAEAAQRAALRRPPPGPRRYRASAPAGGPPLVNRLVGSNRQAGEAVLAAARELGFAPTYLGDEWQGEARDVGRRFAARMIEARAAAEAGPRGLIAGGESTVTLGGAGGRGGRNQEAALAAALALEGVPGVALMCLATDGIDGPTDAAGAAVTGDTVPAARALGLDPAQALAQHNSYPFHQAAGSLLVTGPTGTNVNDLMVGLVYSAMG